MVWKCSTLCRIAVNEADELLILFFQICINSLGVQRRFRIIKRNNTVYAEKSKLQTAKKEVDKLSELTV